MELDRKLQYDILKSLQEVYPDSLLVSSLPGFSQSRFFMGNLFYLQEHGMIEGGDIREPGQCRSMIDAQITKTGLDFVTDDGGLAAILAKMIVRIDKGELLEEIGQGLSESGLEEEKQKEIVALIDKMEPDVLNAIIKKTMIAYMGDKGSQFWLLVKEQARQ